MHKSRSPAACWRLTEVLLLLQRPLSEACSLLIIQFAGCRTALWVLCPQPSVIAYHFTFFHVWPRLILLLIFSIFSWDNRPQCRSLRPRVARPLQLPQLPGEISSICAQGPKTSHSDRAQAASGTSLLNKRSGTAWPSVPTQCLLCLTIHYKWKVPQKLSWSQLACVLAYECFSVSLDLMLFFFLSLCLPCLPKRLSDECWNGNLLTMTIVFWVFWAFYIFTWCNRLKQLTVCHHASPSVILSTTTNCDMSTSWIDFRTRTCCIWCCLRQTDRQTDNCSLFVKIKKILLILQIVT